MIRRPLGPVASILCVAGVVFLVGFAAGAVSARWPDGWFGRLTADRSWRALVVGGGCGVVGALTWLWTRRRAGRPS